MRNVVTDSRASGQGLTGAPSPRSLRILVVLRALNMDRVTEGLLRCLLDAGHTVQVALEQRKAGPTTEGDSLFDALEAECREFSFGTLPPRDEPWLYPATKLRSAIDFLRYFAPEFASAAILRKRARDRAPWYARLLGALGVLRVAPLRRATERFLRAVERRMPVSESSLDMLRECQPDVLIVSPLVETGSPQGDHLRAADRLGIPTVLVVASWDNLTTKGAIRDVPDLTIVWNQDQVREAVDLHGLPAESVVATGAHSHDHWFAWQPATARQEFAAKVGLAEDRPFVLYVCSSGFIAGDDEVAFVREWARRLRAMGGPELQTLGVLVRPHPQNFRSWRAADLDEPGRIVVWPRGGVAPTDRQSKEDYFDSLYHAKAVVGINTTALVDSAIVRRPVLTMVNRQFRSTQTGTIHFSYLAREEGSGLLNVAQSWDEHFDQLGAAVRSPDGHRKQIDSFLRAFIRPQGLERPAAPLALDAIARTALCEKEPVIHGGAVRWIVGATAGALGRMHLVLRRLRLRAAIRAVVKAERRLVKRIRKRAKARRRAARRASVQRDEAKSRSARQREKAQSRAAKEKRKAPSGGAKQEKRAAKSPR
jgi:hypothetical protein